MFTLQKKKYKKIQKKNTMVKDMVIFIVIVPSGKWSLRKVVLWNDEENAYFSSF